MNTDKLRFSRLLVIIFVFLSCLLPCLAQKGNDAQWATAGKQAVGTSANLESKVWFTLANGVMTEVYYPDVTVANVHLLQFVVVNKKTGKIETEQDDTIQEIEYLGNNSLPPSFNPPTSLSFYQTNWSKDKKWRIRKKYITNPQNNTVLIDFEFSQNLAVLRKYEKYEVYVYYDASINNSGMHDTAWTQEGVLLASDGEKVSVLASEHGFEKTTNGFLGVNDGLTQLRKKGSFETFDRAENGNVVQVAKLNLEDSGLVISLRTYFRTTLSLSFGRNPDETRQIATKSLQTDFQESFAKYNKEWSDYVKTLPKIDPKYQAQFNMAAMILKAFEDKTNRGASIASLSIPWGGGANANEVGSSGYHAVWARDLYQVATAFMALGDKDAANRALDFLFKVQQKTDGSFPQNSWLDGKPIGGSLQMDQVGFPLILAHELGRFDKETYQKHVKPAANFIVKNGPTTPQERWEEKGGYSPSTIAAEIAGLVCAAEIAKKNGDNNSAAIWLKTADEWQSNIEKWTVTTTGKHSKSPYYVRLTQNGKPDSGEKYEINGVYGMVDERDIVDAGFLELVRLGIKSADDKIIQNSIKVVDEVIRVKTPNGDGFYRYNFDSYGEQDNGQRWNYDGKWTGKGRLWALLNGERGQYEIALENSRFKIQDSKSDLKSLTLNLESAKTSLESMQKFANDGLMIPEQVWDSANIPQKIDRQFMPKLKFGEGTGSATPLAWSMAQFIRLAVNLKEGRNLDTPKVVYDRYVGKQSAVISQQLADEANKKHEISVNCYGEWWDRHKQPLKKSPTIIKCKDGSYLPIFAFAYSENVKSVEVVGDFTGWKPQNLYLTGSQPYAPSEGDFIDYSRYYPLFDTNPTARIEYKLIVDGKWITDPLNPNKIDNGVGGENSFFTMPDYKPTEWDKDNINPDKNQQIVSVQSLETIEIDSKVYGEKRKIQVLGPMATEIRTTFYPVLYLQDGGEYINRANAVRIQQNLLKAGKIQPFLIVFLDPKDRMKEYWANDDYAKFLAEEVVPVIDSKYNTIKNRDGRAVMGASLGGITAVNVALKYPDVFGRIGGQSSSFWIDNERIVKDLEKLDGKTKFKFYFDDGTLEGVEDSRKVVDFLRKKGFDVTYLEGETGHNWTAWRDRLADAFMAIWK